MDKRRDGGESLGDLAIRLGIVAELADDYGAQPDGFRPKLTIVGHGSPPFAFVLQLSTRFPALRFSYRIATDGGYAVWECQEGRPRLVERGAYYDDDVVKTFVVNGQYVSPPEVKEYHYYGEFGE